MNWLLLLPALLGCPADTTTNEADTGIDTATEPLAAAGYCEASASMYCDFYMRCGRMAAASQSECETTFVEVCNGVYEPRYAALEAAGLLAISEPGLDACAVHLQQVVCDQQIFDLDGPCGEIWQGLVTEGGVCSYGIESFVCESGTECVLGMDFCGTCTVRETDTRPVPGEACSDDNRCRLGADCIDGTCAAPTIVGLGDACDARSECPYRSVCAGSVCAATPLLGESCESGLPCASGWCSADVCVALKAESAGCSGGAECVSGICSGAACAALPGTCFE